MVLSDRTIRAEVEAGRIAFDPYDPSLVQPSSVDERLDNLLGIVQVKDLLVRTADEQGFRIKGILTLPAFIYEGARGPQILESLKKSSAHTAVVLDEYGSVVGVLTLSDVVDAIVGPMIDESRDDDPRALPRDDGSWLVEGRFPIDEFLDYFQIHETTDDDYSTLGGLVVTRLGHIPEVGESVEFQGREDAILVLAAAPDAEEMA